MLPFSPAVQFSINKTAGRIANLEEILPKEKTKSSLGIGHTRWATHGKPNTINAHPHLDYTSKISIVHNGIIENYSTLKKWLINKGVSFQSETDTEVLANLIGYFYETGNTLNGDGPSDEDNKFEWAVQQALHEVVGTYGLAIMCSDFPDTLIGGQKKVVLLFLESEIMSILSPQMHPQL